METNCENCEEYNETRCQNYDSPWYGSECEATESCEYFTPNTDDEEEVF